MAVSLSTRLTELLGCRYPIIQTAMGWVADARLVAATCNAGGFGFLAGATIPPEEMEAEILRDRKSTRLNSSHVAISYAVFCLKKKNITRRHPGSMRRSGRCGCRRTLP